MVLTSLIIPFFEIGFLFNASEGLSIKLLSDDDVGKTTENAADEEQDKKDKKDEKQKRDGRKPHTNTQELLDMDQACSETMVFSTDGNVGFWLNGKGDCSSETKIWGMMGDIINS